MEAAGLRLLPDRDRVDARRKLEKHVSGLGRDEIEDGLESLALDGGAGVKGEDGAVRAGLLDLGRVESDLGDGTELAELRHLRQHAVESLPDGTEADDLEGKRWQERVHSAKGTALEARVVAHVDVYTGVRHVDDCK